MLYGCVLCRQLMLMKAQPIFTENSCTKIVIPIPKKRKCVRHPKSMLSVPLLNKKPTRIEIGKFQVPFVLHESLVRLQFRQTSDEYQESRACNRTLYFESRTIEMHKRECRMSTLYN